MNITLIFLILDSLIQDKIPPKLISSVKLTLENITAKAKVNNAYSTLFSLVINTVLIHRASSTIQISRVHYKSYKFNRRRGQREDSSWYKGILRKPKVLQKLIISHKELEIKIIQNSHKTNSDIRLTNMGAERNHNSEIACL